MDNIKCPKCGSEQVSANKKGWTLTTGAIGMNKVILTCMKCGKQFKPGEDLESSQKKKLQQQESMKKPGFWIFFLLILAGFIFLLKSCFGGSSTEIKSTSSVQNTDSISASLEKYYAIEKEDNDGANIRLGIYVSDTLKIKDINLQIIEKYNPDKTKGMLVAYFNKKGIGKTYFEKQFNDKISDKLKDKLFENFIAEYNLNPPTNYDTLIYMHQ